ncbi:TcpQ domain-containing protein [Achromobacter seleniivolatilans]|uniref:TcpQ domain-containing protein n=1 Tax=Achromobacter seleniivolatilans TaxID=3047478 RepID=A0ABY9M988_9BURK|nr:TcpQ domain-containing protein [Achromobacter sp. R39]WMD23149.1 TcpQ domain-containing protein [Achromobacter sp. R39]
MVRIFFLAAGLSCLAACTSWPAYRVAGSSWQGAGPAAQGFRFDWQLSGDQAVAPMQVFDDGREVWLQFAPGQRLPAIFGLRADGEHALPYTRREPYVVVTGAWGGLLFRGGRLAARARREGEAATAGVAQPAAVTQEQGQPAVATALGVGRLAADGPLAADGAAAGVVAPAAGDAAAAKASPDTARPMPVNVGLPQKGDSGLPVPQIATPTLVTPSARLFLAAPPDTTLRAVLARWAAGSGWTFEAQHWAVDVDIPLSATAEFSGDFKSAVRELLAATELADKPLQPCFYGNQVLRVVPLAQPCSRAASPWRAGA